MTEQKDSSSASKETREAEEHPHGMPLTLGGGGYGGDECTGPKAEQAGHCPDSTTDRDDEASANKG